MSTVGDRQRFLILGHVYAIDDQGFQEALARVYDSGPRPRCLCRGDGVEMYVARHGRFVVKRMPDTGSLHHPGCPSYEPEAAQSGLGELVGDAVLELQPGQVELRVDFPWAHTLSTESARNRGERSDPGEIEAPRRRMSLRAVTHYLFERAGFNRWTPAMAGKRRQAVIQKYLLEAAADISIKGERLAQRMYVPEAFNEATHAEAARRRREKLALLQPTNNRMPLALLIGEFKSAEASGPSVRVWIKHMPDVPLWADRQVWARIERTFAAVFEACGADVEPKPRMILSTLIRARREHTYEIDTASLMLTSEHWIPVEGVHELSLIRSLVEQGRRFVKLLRYDAGNAGRFPNALLLDAGAKPVALHVTSAFLPAAEQAAKTRTLAADSNASDLPWVWASDQPMPPFPAAMEHA
ncbi:DUF1173 family protein [Pseudoxanthomonas sp. JBR18]|uniref:DUF1173 family protein n=1 Tax=Pseudoxanthomonas sp. JBR18 TaxID=2969308 RepID=UPI00230560F8|nr:DUF1173 family protein [Pseudoxanthomonas sp. JBR18]WCE03591.1 DUF1173 family protein [Pseudoxanthomonas sp. JBR18]